MMRYKVIILLLCQGILASNKDSIYPPDTRNIGKLRRKIPKILRSLDHNEKELIFIRIGIKIIPDNEKLIKTDTIF